MPPMSTKVLGISIRRGGDGGGGDVGGAEEGMQVGRGTETHE